jgi:hypothetical protein
MLWREVAGHRGRSSSCGPRESHLRCRRLSILPALYHMLKDDTVYGDLGAAHFDRRRTETQARATGDFRELIGLLRGYLLSAS